MDQKETSEEDNVREKFQQQLFSGSPGWIHQDEKYQDLKNRCLFSISMEWDCVNAYLWWDADRTLTYCKLLKEEYADYDICLELTLTMVCGR